MGRRKSGTDEVELFWSNVDIRDGDGCWEWMGYRLNGAYGRFYFRGKQESSHRISWILINGDIPEGMFVCHRCDNPPCCNPDHLFLGNRSDNMQDMWNKNRHPNSSGRPSHTMIGERNVNSKLSYSDVLKIRDMYEHGFSIIELSRLYPEVQTPAIYKIVHNLRWNNIS